MAFTQKAQSDMYCCLLCCVGEEDEELGEGAHSRAPCRAFSHEPGATMATLGEWPPFPDCLFTSTAEIQHCI